MSWYYAGPEAKPVGPVSVEELHRLRVSGAISNDTFIIEHTGQPGATLAWKRYHEIFPTNLSPAPVPILPDVAAIPPVPPVPPVPVAAAAPHPLFPSARPAVPPPAYAPYAAPPPAFSPQAVAPLVPPPAVLAPPAPGMRPDPYYAVRPTNSWCAWGFGLGLVGFFLSFLCGLGLLPALLSIVLCVVGLAQLQRRHDQAGHGLAVTGLVLSGIALLISLIFILTISIPILKAHEETVNEETPSDSQ